MSQPTHPREVNTLLHTLRGEHYRHLRNAKQSQSHPSALHNYSNTRTLPIGLRVHYDEGPLPMPPAVSHASYSGPAPPKSWNPPLENIHQTASWRAQALSLAISHPVNLAYSRVPSLALLCLQTILSDKTSNSQFREIAPCIPAHLRRDIIRYCAIYSPLPSWKLYAMYGSQGHADHEMLIMGDAASLRDEFFLAGTTCAGDADGIVRAAGVESDWESEGLSEKPLQSLILVSTRVSPSTLLALPPTITRMALINLSDSLAIYKLPKICPLLVLLDLSYNQWLKDSTSPLTKVNWSRWSHLEVLGLKDCAVSEELVASINRGRWDDVKIVT
ncbi:hypothetical protein M413DRAFT_438520 [Hebeloma cylindrosporum]|uniref:Uncharacterized protein n=1 Tax=Hebeloma cylindrosporum TaxID=76867 RepID=A0A0C3CZN8_HEBCY|nr:hypothetical protein M413DRAFT_438520 [Hebeloma cylindrosporum h7]